MNVPEEVAVSTKFTKTAFPPQIEIRLPCKMRALCWLVRPLGLMGFGPMYVFGMFEYLCIYHTSRFVSKINLSVQFFPRFRSKRGEVLIGLKHMLI